jgi:hypothetical protein
MKILGSKLNGDGEILSAQVPQDPWFKKRNCKCIFKTLPSNWEY